MNKFLAIGFATLLIALSTFVFVAEPFSYMGTSATTCNNCHVTTNFSDDSRKNKRIAKQMQEMQDHLNTVRLLSIKELDAEYDKVSCVMCHRGTNEPKGAMPVPQPVGR